jgi:hypothetical protein
MICEEKMQCLECALFSSCPSTTRVFVNYCGSMPNSLKDQINRARIDCRVRRRFQKSHAIRRSGITVTNAIIIPDDVDILQTHSHF